MRLCQGPVQAYLRNDWAELLITSESSRLCESLKELNELGGYVQKRKLDGYYKTAQASNVF